MKSTFSLLILFFSNWALAAQPGLFLGADFEWGAVFNSKFGAEICSVNVNNCKALSVENQTISVDQVRKAIDSDPDLVENDLFRLRWGFFESTECCGDSTRPWLAVEVKLVASEIISGLIRTVHFPGNTYTDSLKCIEPNPVHKTNGLGLLYIGSQRFTMEQIISPKGAVGRPVGYIGISCQK